MIKLSKEMITRICSEANSEAEATVALYKVAFPEFDNIKVIKKWPRVSTATAVFIMTQMRLKKDINGGTAGGLWLNRGFSSATNSGMPDWVVDTSDCGLVMKEVE